MTQESEDQPDDASGPPEAEPASGELTLSSEVELFARDSQGNLVPVEIDSIIENDDTHVVIAEQSSQHIGPLPSVEQFRAYGDVVEDAPERILQMAEKEQAAYHRFMDTQLAGKLTAVSQGQWMGFVLMLIALAGAVYLALQGHTLVATALASPAVLTPIMRFYFQGKQASRDDDG